MPKKRLTAEQTDGERPVASGAPAEAPQLDDVMRTVRQELGDAVDAARNLPGISQEDARAAMEYPDAAGEIRRLAEADRNSVREGEPAPDFELAYLNEASSAKRVRLSDHFGTRPVALVFGSYT